MTKASCPVGTVVQLKSGGPRMTVSGYGGATDEDAKLVFFDGAGDFDTTSLPFATLQKATTRTRK